MSRRLAKPAENPIAADAHEAAHEVLAGEPAKAARRWLGIVVLLAAAGFALNTAVVLSGTLLQGVDVPVERFVQSTPWGPFGLLMQLTNATGGLSQDILGAVVVVVFFVYERRAGWLMALGAIGSLLDQILKVSIARHRPTADLVAILNPSSGYSYPSGHAVFFTWLYFMLAATISPRLSPHWRRVTWAITAALVFFACLGRIWVGAHWPTDVFGGFLLGLGWSAFVLWVPERWLPSPSWRWVRPRRRRRVQSAG